jgi:hypothetical protein
MTKNMNHVIAGPSQGKKKATTKAIRVFFSSVLNTHRKLPKLRESKCPPFISAHHQRVRKQKYTEQNTNSMNQSAKSSKKADFETVSNSTQENEAKNKER